MTRLDAWTLGFEPAAPQDLKLAGRVSPALVKAFEQSYASLNADDIDRAAVILGTALKAQICELHERFDLARSLATDLSAVALVIERQVA
jgi:hypothetical protein